MRDWYNVRQTSQAEISELEMGELKKKKARKKGKKSNFKKENCGKNTNILIIRCSGDLMGELP